MGGQEVGFEDEDAQLDAAEAAREEREMAGMSQAEREDYLAVKAERAAEKNTMLRSQLGVYSKKPALNNRGKGRKNKKKSSSQRQQQQQLGGLHEDSELSDKDDGDDENDDHYSDSEHLDEDNVDDAEALGAHAKGTARHGGGKSRRKAQRQKELNMERETRRALKNNKKSKNQLGAVDVEAEERRQSRLLKLRALQRELDDSDDESVPQSGSLLERLRGTHGFRSSKRRPRNSEDIDDTPLPIALWIFLIFTIVAIDRSVKFLAAHADPVIVSKVLGAVLITGSFGVKVPQIASIMDAKTVKGLSSVKSYTAIQALVLTVAYSLANKHPFTSWGDSLSVLIQELIIVGLMWTYGETSLITQVALSLGFLGFVGTVASFTLNTRPEKLWALPLLSSVISLSGTIPQIIENFNNQHTGALSFVTQLMVFLGVVARVFTTLTEVNDPVVLGAFVLSSVVNGVLLAQIFLYWGNTKRVLAKEAAKRRKSKSS
ncbi:Mannose-P-dolichol utilization defect 1 protein-like 1 [Hondaea fermentalgiana]|uniref:Mannose-P-dolichol utilization defect 1 protein-like 1 n=1 Tax=Hondaea fermentalgiana TaxID=2315210 RepID=A0A2R5GIZ9_9STRA|nr:Mannose-P-dolichol utilization defect 1 protein-like 1 [Hondaea fermentalgiana]|eukprot:GBG30585.1 Mannose-P-dolichol utilization defect 1 protein-like 1 [Hondaea fermentalgiana]